MGLVQGLLAKRWSVTSHWSPRWAVLRSSGWFLLYKMAGDGVLELRTYLDLKAGARVEAFQNDLAGDHTAMAADSLPVDAISPLLSQLRDGRYESFSSVAISFSDQ